VTTVATTPRDWKPTGVAVAPDGALWVLEASSTNAQRVRRIAPDGSSRIF
jgi:DNA-binding beta-propeller fold protein YncE